MVELALKDQLDKIERIEQVMQTYKEAEVQPPMDLLASYIAIHAFKPTLQELHAKFHKH